MSNSDDSSKIIRDRGGVFSDIGQRIKLIIRLIADPRVNILLKLLPIASLVYLLIPAPIPPDLIPTPIDDALIVWLGTYLFVELCPEAIVKEHMRALNQEIPAQWQEPVSSDDNVIDTEFSE